MATNVAAQKEAAARHLVAVTAWHAAQLELRRAIAARDAASVKCETCKKHMQESEATYMRLVSTGGEDGTP